MTEQQRIDIASAMQAYELYEQTGISTFTSTQLHSVAKVRKSMGMRVSVCRGCLDEVVQYVKEIYELYKS